MSIPEMPIFVLGVKLRKDNIFTRNQFNRRRKKNKELR